MLISQKDIFQLALRLSRQEKRQFYHFLNSTFAGNGRKMNELAALWEKVAEIPHDSQITEEEFLTIAFGESKSTNYLRVRLTLLHKQLLRFLALQEFEKDQHMTDLYTLFALTNHSAEHELRKQFKRQAPTPDYCSASELFANFLRNRIYLNLLSDAEEKPDSRFRMNMTDDLEKIQLLFFLESVIIDMADPTEKPENYPTWKMDDILHRTEKLAETDEQIRLYLSLYRLYVNNQPAGIYALLEDLYAHPDAIFNLDRMTAESFLSLVLHFITKHLNQGKADLKNECLRLMQMMEEKEVVLENNQIPHWHLINLFRLTLQLEGKKPATDLLHKYDDRVVDDPDNVIYNYLIADLNYRTINSSESLTPVFNASIGQVPQDDPQLKFQIAVLQLKIYFDHEKDTLLESAVNSIIRRVKKQKNIDKMIQKSYLSLATNALTIHRIRMMKTGKKKMQQLKQASEKIDSAKDLLAAHKTWLQSEIEAINRDQNH